MAKTGHLTTYSRAYEVVPMLVITPNRTSVSPRLETILEEDHKVQNDFCDSGSEVNCSALCLRGALSTLKLN
nr:hypothetical protein A4A49_30543 [Ipomoea batatas]GMC82226.1 hypothetical protein A4A49_30543 [Ipomoea batatas]GMC90505.1 hypothetical protein A4A49_30543 [Ipomoea batatas]GMD29686.1 hypothetical protein A4A49_30543 [Ipomoea batatas]